MRRRMVILGAAMLTLAGQAAPPWAQQDLQGGLQDLLRQMIAGMEQQQKRKLAILDFTKLDRSADNFGRYLAERLITGMFLTRKFEVIERTQLDKLLAELKLGPSDLLDPQNAKRLGKASGVDAIASGSVSELAAAVAVDARLIEVDTGRVFAVAATTFAKDKDVVALIGGAFEGRPPAGVPSPRQAPPRGERFTRIDLEDNFGSDLDATKWTRGRGFGFGDNYRWVTVNSSLTHAGVWGYIYAGNPDWKDYAVEAGVDFSEAKNARVEILVRVQEHGSYYAVQLGQDGQGLIAVFKQEFERRRREFKFQTRPLVNLRVEVAGTRIGVLQDNQLLGEFQDSTYQSGKIGFRLSQGSGHNAAIRSVRVLTE